MPQLRAGAVKFKNKKKERDRGFESQPTGSSLNLSFGWVQIPSELGSLISRLPSPQYH